MKSSTKGGTVVTLAVLGILLASVITAVILNRAKGGDRKSIGQSVPFPTPPASGAPYFVRVTLDKAFTQELHFTTDGKQRIGYQKDGTDWLIDVETHRKTANAIQVSMQAERFSKPRAYSGTSSLGFSNTLLLDAAPITYPKPSSLPKPKPNSLLAKVHLPTYTISVNSEPTIGVQSKRLATR